ncbi:MAG TPA: ABC transporter permease [Bryobacteraceae bacterium]|nr:ABC transporter permease [Bryobacteraceae bacterium]
MLTDVIFRLRCLLRRKKVETELDDELRFHFDQQVEKYLHSGLTHEEAVRSARLFFGGMDQVKEECRDARGVQLMETFFLDIRYGLRMLRKKPAFTLVAILTLALGVGANTAIFSIVNAVLLRSLPYRDPDRLVRILSNNPGVGLRDIPFSVPELDDLRTRSGVFEDVSAIGGGSVNLTGARQPERLEFIVTYPNYFSMLGATPQIGRLLGSQDFALGFASAAVISDGLWRRSYGADPSVLGRTLHLDNDPYTIVGVLPPGFRHPGPTISGNAEVFLTAGFSADPAPKPARGARILPAAIGRLKPGLTLPQAQARLTAMAAELRHDFPADYPARAQWTIEIQSLQESLVGNVRPMLLVLMGAVVLIVFIVSLNIANLLLARASGRQQEMAVRLAMGASRGRMIRQMLTESLLLSLIGGLAGIATAIGTLSFILHFVPSNIPRLSEVNIDWRVLAFALLISLLTGLLFGLVPAIHSSRSDLTLQIREGSRGSGYGAKTGRLRDALIVSELAFAVVLMVGAGLLLRTLRELLQENPGFNPTHVVAANVWLPLPNDPKVDPYLGVARKATFNRELLRRMKAIPGVELAGLTSALPATALNNLDSNALTIEDRPIESSQNLRAEIIRISPDYFRVMQAPLVRGRFFAESDEDGKQRVAIIDETTAHRYWTDRDPLGRRLRFGQDPTQPWMTVVGVVKDIKHDGLDIDGVPHIFVSIYQSGDRQLGVVLRTSLPASLLERQIRREVQSIDPGLPVFDVSSMNDVIDRSLAARRFSAGLVGGFAGLALLLASIGIYGLLAFMAGQRSREIGLRIALGAGPADVLKLFLHKGVVLASAGIVAGVIVSASTASIMASLLYGVRPHDPAVFLAVPLLLLAVSVLASYLPARRATKVDPMFALREV